MAGFGCLKTTIIIIIIVIFIILKIQSNFDINWGDIEEGLPA